MRHLQRGSFRRHATLLRPQFLQDGGLPFTDVLTDQVLTDALAAVGHWLDRVAGADRSSTSSSRSTVLVVVPFQVFTPSSTLTVTIRPGPGNGLRRSADVTGLSGASVTFARFAFAGVSKVKVHQTRWPRCGPSTTSRDRR